MLHELIWSIDYVFLSNLVLIYLSICLLVLELHLYISKYMEEYSSLYYRNVIFSPALFFWLLYMVHQNLLLVVFQHRIHYVFYLQLFDKLFDVFSINTRDKFLNILSIIIDNEIGDENKKKYDHLVLIRCLPEKRLFSFWCITTHFIIKKKFYALRSFIKQ